MSHIISEECINCGACASVCPVDAISEGAEHYEVDPNACIDCGACEEACPTGTITAE